MTVPPEMFRALVDDASMFPPGNAPVGSAVRRHREYRSSWFAPLVGPLVVRVADLPGLADTAGLAVSVICPGGRSPVPPAGVTVAAVEFPLDGDLDPAAPVLRLLDQGTPAVFVEFPDRPGWERAAEATRSAGGFGKIRTGGPDLADTPGSAALARRLAVLVGLGLPFKATAGLHHAWAIPGGDDTRPGQHGFLNLMLAVDTLLDGGTVTDATDVLAAVGGSPGLLRRLEAADTARIARLRHLVRSFGCCGVTDPIAGLIRSGLLEEPR